ncbi:sodium:solute symporter family protein [Coraliomargarita algicola]|uniref:Sodium:solute symporter family protein n=1 Tax=Coraliomargarita algicola TaxID=3092156 RepID=A0ABZ0RIQ0_9BACT|nr:sodium:solute symporter family protein [Coraliomargarita sp. J2-16]WPJ95124.1 sodium:solute symporter family protein [Coraliomargarita sp. J2-16]
MLSIDYFVLAIYLAGIFGVGLFLSSKNKSSADMFAAGGESPWWTSGLSSFMTMFSAGTFVVWGGIAYQHGLVAVVINLCYGVAALLVGFFVAGHWKRMGVKTPAEFIELRFGASAVQFYTWAMMIFRIVGVAVSLYSLSIVLVAMMPLADGNPLQDPTTGNLSLMWAIVIFGGIVVIYTMAGGLWAVLMTDVLQFIVLNLAVLFIVPLAFGQVGGVSAFLEKAPEGFFALTSDKYTMFFLVGWVVIHFFMIGAEWAFAQRFICVSSEKDAKKSCFLFGGLYLCSPILWLLPPMIYRTMDPNADPQEAYILACRAVLPAGMVGLMVAAMFSATASMVSSQLNVFAGVLTDEIYRRVFRPSSSEKHLVNVGRLFTIALGAVLIAVSLLIPYLGGAEKVVVAITSLMVGPLLAPTIWGLFSRRIGIRAIWMTVAISFILGLILKLGLGANGWLLSGSTIALAEWIQANGTTVDLIIGVLIPVSILTTMHYWRGETSIGWIRVQKQVSDVIAAGKVTEASALPAIIVGGCLLVCALLMFGLIPFNESGHGILAVFGAVLLCISGSIFLFIKTQKRRTLE